MMEAGCLSARTNNGAPADTDRHPGPEPDALRLLPTSPSAAKSLTGPPEPLRPSPRGGGAVNEKFLKIQGKQQQPFKSLVLQGFTT